MNQWPIPDEGGLPPRKRRVRHVDIVEATAYGLAFAAVILVCMFLLLVFL